MLRPVAWGTPGGYPSGAARPCASAPVAATAPALTMPKPLRKSRLLLLSIAFPFLFEESLSLLWRAVSRIYPLRCSTKAAHQFLQRLCGVFHRRAIAAAHHELGAEGLVGAFAVERIGTDGHILVRLLHIGQARRDHAFRNRRFHC